MPISTESLLSYNIDNGEYSKYVSRIHATFQDTKSILTVLRFACILPSWKDKTSVLAESYI